MWSGLDGQQGNLLLPMVDARVPQQDELRALSLRGDVRVVHLMGLRG